MTKKKLRRLYLHKHIYIHNDIDLSVNQLINDLKIISPINFIVVGNIEGSFRTIGDKKFMDLEKGPEPLIDYLYNCVHYMEDFYGKEPVEMFIRILSFDNNEKIEMKLKNERSSGMVKKILKPNMDYDRWGLVEQDYNKRVIKISSNINVEIIYDLEKDVYNGAIYYKDKLRLTFRDMFHHNDDSIYFSRVVDNTKTIYYDNQSRIKKIDQNIFVKDFIKPLKQSSCPNFEDITYSFDIETMKSDEKHMQVYACGFYGKKYLKIYYKKKGEDGDNLIRKAIVDMFEDMKEESKRYVWVHNLDKFDSVYILKSLVKIYQIHIEMHKGVLYAINISQERKTIVFKDSLHIINSSLKAACAAFNVETQKGEFPHDFISEDTLNYIGKHPTNIDWVDWDVEKASKDYLKKDLKGLHEVMCAFWKSTESMNINILQYSTIAGIAFANFRTNFLKGSKIGLVGGKVRDAIKESYFGGMVDVYKPIFSQNNDEVLYYYDVNSMYPYAMLNDMPIYPVAELNHDLDLKSVFGFVYAIIDSTNASFLSIPFKYNSKIVRGSGVFKGWYFSEELKQAERFGYKIKPLKAFVFEKASKIFNGYVNKYYNQKKYSKNSVDRTISKLSLNTLYGRFALDINNNIVIVTTKKEFEKINKYEIKSYKELDNEYFLVELVENANIEGSIQNDFLNTHKNNYNSIHISSAIASYARIMFNDLLYKYRDCIYYIDTDAVFLTKQLPNTGDDIGQFKLVDTIKNAVFISSKFYAYVNLKGMLIKKSKGFDSSLFTWNDYLSLYRGGTIKVKTHIWKRHHGKGVEIRSSLKAASLMDDSKRVKVFINGTYLDTKPIVFSKSTAVARGENDAARVFLGENDKILSFSNEQQPAAKNTAFDKIRLKIDKKISEIKDLEKEYSMADSYKLKTNILTKIARRELAIKTLQLQLK